MKICIRLFLIFLFSLSISCEKNLNKKPKTFDNFWQKSLENLESNSLHFEIIRDSIVNEKKWLLYKINSFSNTPFYSWVSEPVTEGKFPVKIRYSALGNKNRNFDSIPHSWFLKDKQTINVLVDVRGQGLSSNEMEIQDYLTHGLSSEKTYVYRGAYLDAVRAVDFAAQNPKNNGNIIVTGGSQGGALSVAATALNPKVTMCVIGFPFLTDIANYDKKNWPMSVFMYYCYKEEEDYFDLIDRLSFFDMIYFADKIKVPTFIKAQEVDNITPIEGVKKFYNKLNTKKQLYIEPCEGHGCVSKSQTASNLEKDFIKENIIN